MNKKGFTLVELLAVIALVAILSGLAVANVVASINNSKKNNFLMDAKRMVSKAEYLMSQNRNNRELAKTANGIKFSYNDLNEKNEFLKDADGGDFDTHSFVKVTYSNNQYVYCICVIGSKRIIGDKCDSISESTCVLSTNLTSIDVVDDKEED